MGRAFRIAALLAVLACLPGCWVLCAFCPVVKSPPRGDRDTPENAVDFLVDAFRRDAVLDLFESLHEDFRAENGKFGASDFSAAYAKYKDDFRADAESLAAAARSDVAVDAQGVAWITLRGGPTSAEVTIGFVDVPKILVATKDPVVPQIGPAEIDKSRLVRLADGRLSLPAEFDLTSIQGVSKETVAGIRSEDVLRVEIHDDWVVRYVPQERAKNIRFLDKLKELTSR